MSTAFILINTEISQEADVLKQLKGVTGIKEAYLVYGTYDIIARLEAKNMQDLKDIITWKIRRLDNVRGTLTMIVV